MNDFLPPYRRGVSISGYIAACSTGRNLIRAVPNMTDRNNICREHAQQSREMLRQPFSK